MTSNKSTPTVLYLKRREAVKKKLPKKSGGQNGKGIAYHHDRQKKDEGPPASRKPDIDPENYRLAWVGALGKRLRIDDRKGLVLDGQPASLDTVMKETNRIRRANGLPPVGKKKEWLV